ncbi:hypothetical protein CEY16_01395 [Halalkalibacillus sediminis]|uniref:Uncharacterized protein n=1 Tax=Halalkalibacillus sediminis TaxID=2018042 RepID=A0A2I0QWG9_9BACI|nr:hypothetical protein [Halalkalibacillus sediminis]PKR78440.1 hypothetical protein CEY16_01395 [Halalkalibacillus sediminis]
MRNITFITLVFCGAFISFALIITFYPNLEADRALTYSELEQLHLKDYERNETYVTSNQKAIREFARMIFDSELNQTEQEIEENLYSFEIKDKQNQTVAEIDVGQNQITRINDRAYTITNSFEDNLSLFMSHYIR